MKKRGYDDQIFKQLTKITYTLKKDEDGMGLSIVSYSNNGQVHIQSGDG